MGETRVDLVHILEDLRDAYPGPIEETILTEMLANALDSGARSLELCTDREQRTLLARDDGRGMTRRELSRYHDLGASTKRRGAGIGFAGVGIKLGLLACDEVQTETRRGQVHAATTWRLASRARAPWSWIEPPHLLEADGTAVLLRLTNPLSLLLDAGFLETTVIRNFQAFFEPEFIEILAASYPHGFSITIDGRVVVGPIRPAARSPIAIKVGRQRKPSGIGYLCRHDEALPEHERGLAVSTLGKVIRRGWDWLGITPAHADRIEGLIEVPALAESLTLNKGDFLRTGSRGALFLSYRKAIQEVVGSQLEAWGAAPPPKRAPRALPLERDIRRVLGDLADEYPLLATLVERTPGGQRRLPIGDASATVGARPYAGSAEVLAGRSGDDAQADAGMRDAAVGQDEAVTAGQPTGTEEHQTAPQDPTTREAGSTSVATGLPGPRRARRPATLALQIRFETLEDQVAFARLIESTVWVNDAHPAYRRALASRAEAYHVALAVASALAPLAVEAEHATHFISAFLARWGAAASNGRRH
jgi:hypothetical protein